MSCRGDQLCVDGAGCAAWQEAPLWADFEVFPSSTSPLALAYQVLPGGFPRDRVEHIRMRFGDEHIGWGEFASHTYAAPGIYPLELEVQLEGLVVLRASRLVSVGTASTSIALTVDEIPEYLNGSAPYFSTAGTLDPADDLTRSFTLLVPSFGFTVDVALFEDAAALIERDSLSLTCDTSLAGGSIPAGSELVGFLDDAAGDAHQRVPRFVWTVGAAQAFPTGSSTLTLQAQDTNGVAYRRQLTIEVEELPPERQPFLRPLTWLLLFDTDLFTTQGGVLATGAVNMDSVLGPDGVPDFQAELALLGAQSEDSAPGAASVVGRGQVGASAVFLAWVKRRIAEEIGRTYGIAPNGTAYDGISFRILADGEADAPSPASFRADGEFSMLRLGGVLEGGHLGYSFFSPYNEERIDDSAADLGVATCTILNTLGATPVLTDSFDPIKPGVGTPVGEDPLDAVVLADTFERYDSGNSSAANARYDSLATLVRFIALPVASVAAHEMGHAMGLVPDGPPPDGFFGGRNDVYFGPGLAMGPNTDSHHADYPGLNLMQAGGNFLSVISNALAGIEHAPGYDLVDLALGFAYEDRLSPYSRAYLQGRLSYRNFNGALSGYGP